MVARKSSRVKKSPVVYQAPEAVPRAVRAPSTPKQAVVNRRIFGKDVDLQMECVDDELSPAQLKALKEAQQEHDKANEMIKEVRAGNILVPSSQPNTFTIVPPKPPQPPPQQTPPPVQQQQAPPIQLQKLPSPPEEAGSQRGLPPPRPAQFLNRQLQEISKSQGSRAPEVLLISDNSAMTGGPKLTTQTLLGTQISTQPLQFQQMTLAGHQVTMSGGAGVMPQQVYKFVSLPSNMQPNIVPNQWALRPLLTVSPQQQQQMSLVGSNQQGVPQFATMTLAQQPRILPAQPAQVSVPSKISKIDTAAKRPACADVAVVEPPAKKRAGKEEVQDDTGNWVPLDEYYYGTHEGDPSYTEEKGEYRFKCWYCSKMLYNNVRAMQHIQGHIDASKQQNIDLSDLTQCKHCYKQFDTPFEMQTHVEKVHLSNKVLMCRICERDFSTPRELTQHMKGNHHACEMPYVCHLCNFRSSMYSDVVDHFKKRHDSSHFMLCLYCLRTFEVKFVSQGWGQTQTYYGHLLKHQTKSSTKKCVVCRLTFFNAIDVKTHRKNCHVGNHLDVKASSHSGKSEAGSSKKRGSQLKSLNAPSVSRIQDYGTVVFPEETNTAKCIECKMIMSSNDHYKKYVHCTMCRFATSCSVAYAKHMMGFHSGQMSSLNMNIPWERPMKDVMYCACGFKSAYGNKVANHLVYCGKWTCYSTQVQASDQTAPSKVEEKTEGSLLGMLGLVSKDQVIPTDDDAEIISSKPRPKCKTKLAVDTSTADTEVITLENTKPAVDKDQTKDNTEEITEDKDIDEQESKSDEKEENKKGKEDDKQILETKIKEPSDDQPSRSVEINKSELTEDKAKGDNSPAEVVETVKNVDENEKKSLEETEVTRETMKEDKPQGMEKEETNSRDNKLESKTEQKDQTASLKVDSKRSNKDQDSEPTSELKTSSEEQMQIGDGDSGRKKESDEMLQEKKEELEIFTDAENKKVADEETKAEQDKEKEVNKDTEVHDLTEDTGAENMEEDKLEEKSKDGQTLEESGKVKEKEYESVEENKPDSMVIEDSAVTTEDKSGEKQDSSISLETQPETSGKDQAGDLERRESQSSDRYSNERDRQSHERDRQSHERDHQSHERDRQSRERDRHNSGGRHEDRPHQDDRNNRSYGSNRSDGYHGNRPYEQNRDRDRSSDRDYNRNQGYRQGDNRSGYGGYQDNRGQGYGGGGNYRGQGGQYGGYHGNRGGHYQDRNRGGNQQGNFNRNSQNRGGYNQNYRGGGYGGGYY